MIFFLEKVTTYFNLTITLLHNFKYQDIKKKLSRNSVPILSFTNFFLMKKCLFHQRISRGVSIATKHKSIGQLLAKIRDWFHDNSALKPATFERALAYSRSEAKNLLHYPILQPLHIVCSGFLTIIFHEDPLYYHIFFIFQPPFSHYFCCLVSFAECVILLHLMWYFTKPSTLVSEAPSYMFYETRCPFFIGLTKIT